MTLVTTIEWNADTGDERELTVEFNYHRGRRGARDSLGGVARAGPPLEPDDPPELEVVSARMHSPTFHDREATEDVWHELSERQQEQIKEQCMELLEQ